MSVENLQDIRYLLYPVIVVAALGWAAMFWLRWYRWRLATDFLEAQIGMALATWAALSIAALSIASSSGFSAKTALLLTLGVGIIAIVLVAAMVIMLYRTWIRIDE